MRKFFLLLFFIIINILLVNCNSKKPASTTGNVIFFHPDGTGLAGWNAMRLLYYGPDSNSNWDKLTNIGLYRSHLRNSIGVTSNAGATIHAYGVKVERPAFGLDNGKIIIAKSGKKMSIMMEAIEEGIKTGLINSGSIVEPGTAVFVSSVEKRAFSAEITKQVIQSGVDVILSGGEEWLIPKGTQGIHTSGGERTDSLNLIEWAKQQGYKVVYTKAELKSIPMGTNKVLGIFSKGHTFNDKREEVLTREHLPNFKLTAPTVAEMTEAAIKILSKNNDQFFLVVEEEGTDNFGNKNNANATLEALKMTDDAIGVASEYINNHPNTLIITASDSEAGGLEVIGNTISELNPELHLPEVEENGSPLDGIRGKSTKPFLAAPDIEGNRLPFYISWSTTEDTYGSVVVKASGLKASRVKGSMDNTEIYVVMYEALFGKYLGK